MTEFLKNRKIEVDAVEKQIDVVEELISNIRQSNIENFKKNFHENEKLLSSDPMGKSFVDQVKSVFCYMVTKVCGFFGRADNPRGKFAKEVEKQIPSLAPAA
ncbi:hypothetical protein [Candidiatus Paracoxiella cheracis]|uniref:hypothetical protein n=1 Tax=Candidiatus Paracoxiella cheracis TaxID=3405120 RepID=UPI003BF5EB16